MMVTSWLQHGMCEVDFGAGARPRFVEALMPGWIMQLMESRYGDPVDDDDDDDHADGERVVDDHDDDGSETVNTSNSDSGIKASERLRKKKKRPWYSSGVDISFNLEAEVAEKLSQEPLY